MGASEIRLLRDQAGQPLEVVGSWSDITERKQLEEQYRQTQKLEAIGMLAGGLAIDFNNLLTIITGYSDIYLGKLRPEDPLRIPLIEIRKAGERATALTRQLLAFSRKQILKPVVLDLNPILAELAKMLPRLIGEDVVLTITAGPDLWHVNADPGQMEQVVMNLVVNARDAMPQGGKLLLETKNVEVDARYAETHAEARARASMFCWQSPIPAAAWTPRSRPVFSSPSSRPRARPREPGLGLATVFGIVKQSGGHIEVYSEIGKGTTFKIYLPRDKNNEPVAASPRTTEPVRSGAETILLVEDEDGVRFLAQAVLQTLGYTVLEARHGGDALLLVENRATPIDLMITDVVMPNLSGRELAERLATRQPTMRVLFMSGYTDDAIVRHGILAGMTFLEKPFAPEALARKVREVLDRAAEAETDVSESSKPAPVRILLVDDHSILRAGIRKILQKIPDTEVIAEAGDGREAIALVGEFHPDVVFMDIAMSGMNGIEATARLSKEHPSVRVIILSMHADEEHVWQALRAGAVGYLLKHADPTEIALALEKAARGESYITPAVSKPIVAEFIRRGGTEVGSVELLTSRQREILQLLAEGKNTKEIARLLSISAKTVESHRAQIMERLDIHDLSGLVRYAIRVGLIQSDA